MGEITISAYHRKGFRAPWALRAALGALAVAGASPGSAQTPAIRHEAVECMLPDRFTAFEAEVEPAGEIRTAKLYFRSDKYFDFYYVEMEIREGRFVGVLPMPGPETERVIYYIEAVDRLFNVSRTEENDPAVEEDCRSRPAGALFPGGDPGIVVGATQAGASAIPPGFTASGIVGFIGAASAGGGIGLGTAVVVGAGAAGAGAVVATRDGKTTSSVTSARPPLPTSTAGSSTSTVRPSTTIPGPSSSTTSSLPTTTSSVAPAPPTTTTTTTKPTTTTSSTSTSSISSTTSSISSSTTSSTTTSSTTTSISSSVRACFTYRILGDCTLLFDALCSEGLILEYRWSFTLDGETITQNGPLPTATVNWGDDCEDETMTAQLTVVGPGGNTDTTTTDILLEEDDFAAIRSANEVRTRFRSLLDVPPADGSVAGYVRVDGGALQSASNAGWAEHASSGRRGARRIEAFVTSGSRRAGSWRFDFSETEGFVRGSLRIRAGQVLLLDDRSVVFRLSGREDGRISFQFDIGR